MRKNLWGEFGGLSFFYLLESGKWGFSDFQTVDDAGNERRKKCINLYSPEQDNRNLRLVSANIIKGRDGEDHRVSRSSMLGSEFSRDSIVE